MSRSACFVVAVSTLWAAAWLAAAGEGGVYIDRDPVVQAADRERLARNIMFHDFENRRDPDTGALLAESADFDNNNWPDFWEPVRAVGYPEYLIEAAGLANDTTGMIHGAYRDRPYRALRLEYDGTRVGVRTRVPVPVDPSMSYEFSLRTRDRDLEGAAIRAGLDWLQVDQASVQVVRSDFIPGLTPGQLDWAATPSRMLVNDPPPQANAVRFFVIVERDPGAVSGGYHGELWVDEVRLQPKPRIMVAVPRADAGRQGRVVSVSYSGLYDNIPDPDNPGFFRGKRYTRRVEVTDIHNRPVLVDPTRVLPIEADDDGLASEDVPFPGDRFGVYYFNIRLYDANQQLATDVMRSVAIMRPAPAPDGMAVRSGKPVFGVNSGEIPESVLSVHGRLREMLSRSGSRQAKLLPWRDDYARPGENDRYYNLLTEEIRGMRSAGIGLTGVMRPPTAMFGTSAIAQAIEENPERLGNIMQEAGRSIGLFIDGWQRGDDGDTGMIGMSPERMESVNARLADFASGLPVSWNRRLGDDVPGDFPERPDYVNAFEPSREPAGLLWRQASALFPWLFAPYSRLRGEIYPPERLVALAPPPATDTIEQQARERMRTGAWISLQPEPADPHEPNAGLEKTQLEQLMIRAIYASVLAPETIFLGPLYHPRHGLLRRDAGGTDTLETSARPAYLAASTLAEMLEGTQYLGQLALLWPFEAHVFRTPGRDQSVIAIWHNDAVEERTLSRGEIANGPPLTLVDWAGNRDPAPASIPVRRAPTFITGLPASLALTRMSVRVSPEPQAMAQTKRQNQMLEVVNHMNRQAPILFRLRYAARPEDGAMENGWTVSPEELRVNLPPYSPALTPGRLRYTVSPDPSSPVQHAAPGRSDKSGTKIAQTMMSVNSSPPADMTLFLPFNLHSEIDVDIERLERVDDPHFVTLQLKVRWFPTGTSRRRPEIRLTPYFMKKGQMKEPAPFPVAVKPLPVEMKGDPLAMFESIELRIPKAPYVRTWVGLEEDGGSAYYLVDVTDFMLAQ